MGVLPSSAPVASRSGGMEGSGLTPPEHTKSGPGSRCWAQAFDPAPQSGLVPRRHCGITDAADNGPMLYTGPGSSEATDAHEGYVAGRYRDGSHSDIWTNVQTCATGTFTAYVPACECGWLGKPLPATEHGYQACEWSWMTDHFALVDRALGSLNARRRPLQMDVDFIAGWPTKRSSTERASVR